MSGIFGVGLGEILMIVMALLIIGGPRNVVKWSYEAGKMLRQLRQAWSRLTADLNKELDPETRELVNASRELTQSLKEIRSAADPLQLVNKISQPGQPNKPAPKPEAKQEAPPVNGRYNDWMPKQEDESIP